MKSCNMSMEYYNNLIFLEYYSWYDGPLYYTLKDKHKDLFYVCYMYDENVKNVSHFIVEVNEEELNVMKTSYVNDWFKKLFDSSRIYILLMNYKEDYLEVKKATEKEFIDGIPQFKIHFEEY